MNEFDIDSKTRNTTRLNIYFDIYKCIERVRVSRRKKKKKRNLYGTLPSHLSKLFGLWTFVNDCHDSIYTVRLNTHVRFRVIPTTAETYGSARRGFPSITHSVHYNSDGIISGFGPISRSGFT